MKEEESASLPPPILLSAPKINNTLRSKRRKKSSTVYSHMTSIRNTWVCIKLKLTDFLNAPKRTFMTKLNIVLLSFSTRTSGELDLVKLDLN